MKTLLVSPLVLLLFVGIISNSAEGMGNTPFDYKGTGVLITNFEMDFKDVELILDVNVSDKIGTLEINFEREFFDSTYLGADDDFTIIADGELVYYKEIHTTMMDRTLQFNLIKGTEQVEIFGTKLMGLSFESEKEVQEKPQIFEVQSAEVNQLSSENEKLTQENNILKQEKDILREETELLKKENKELDSRIFELENLVSSLQHQVNNLNALVMEQVKVIYNWVLGSPIS